MHEFKLFIILCSSSYILARDITVELPLGTVKGSMRSTIKGTQFYAFQGIPYAEAPIGDLRFQAPIPKSKWNGIWDATKEGNICNQMTHKSRDQSEDCLFLNVYTPNVNASLSVMFFIYGGGFIGGSSSIAGYGPNFLMEEDVVLVTFNYRVGPYGFFSTQDDLAPGNAGLKDQNLALNWTNQYIEYFGGDPNKITIFGQSAGSASCGYHILSPLSKGLFRAAILHSGTALSPWAYQRNHQLWSRNLIKLMDPDNYGKYNTSKKIYEYLKQAPVQLINSASISLQAMNEFGYLQLYQGFFFAPVYEHKHEGAFLTRRAYESLEQGEFSKVSVLLGATSEEEYIFLNNKENVGHVVERFTKRNDSIPDDMHAAEENKDKIKAAMMKFYTSGGKYADNPRNIVTLMSDHDFVKSILKFAEFLMMHSQNPYLYQFSYKGVLGSRASHSEKGFSERVCHGEELRYIFSATYAKFNSTDLSKFPKEDQLVQKRFVRMMTNFAKDLDPTPKKERVLQDITWPKTDPNFTYLDIGSDMEVKKHMKYEMYNFWNDLYAQYGVPPLDTY